MGNTAVLCPAAQLLARASPRPAQPSPVPMPWSSQVTWEYAGHIQNMGQEWEYNGR